MTNIKPLHIIGSNSPKAIMYCCDRCLTYFKFEDDKINDETKEAFDYKAITGHLMCPKCREEFDHIMSKAWKAKVIIKYGDYHGDIEKVQEDRFEKRQEAINFFDKTQKTIFELISQGYVIKEFRTELLYVPYADRRD